ncbi:hypothetical protein FLK61_41560 [Paenalkalicoccus suaedae]|uniref:Uncharacterized protein n=1 Tax=Paenalkalicoccus suaedae TaxID=2592382 RepID=A0A859FJV8_9BACI|nr:hypothetical protein [Paenalkalicoccus suaedae]QKS73079.1 hypothetical protein FLK61_41560 [Paenalkalicoccus suaedae]
MKKDTLEAIRINLILFVALFITFSVNDIIINDQPIAWPWNFTVAFLLTAAFFGLRLVTKKKDAPKDK